MTAIDTARSVVSHRGMSCLDLHRNLGQLTRRVRQLTVRAEQATAMEARLDEQAKTIDSLRGQLSIAKTIRDETNAKANRCDEAEIRATKAERQMRQQDEELTALRAFKSNACSVSTLPPHQAPAAPAPLVDRFEHGGPVRLGASPHAATNPGHTH